MICRIAKVNPFRFFYLQHLWRKFYGHKRGAAGAGRDRRAARGQGRRSLRPRIRGRSRSVHRGRDRGLPLEALLEKFKPAAIVETVEGEIPLLDLKGVACPMNYVKVKLKLETMAVGQELEVILDQGEPFRMVPASLRNDGHEIVHLEPIENAEFYRLGGAQEELNVFRRRRRRPEGFLPDAVFRLGMRDG